MRQPIEHGTNSGYHKGCKCLDCKAAHSIYSQEERRLRKLGLPRVDRRTLRKRKPIHEDPSRVERMMQLVDSLFAKRPAA